MNHPSSYRLLEMKHDTLVAALDAARKTALGITYIEGEHNEVTVSYAQIYERALALLHHFQAKGAQPGAHMILLLASNEQFVDAFWACQLGRIIAVPIAVGNNEEQRMRLLHVAERLGDPFLCSGEKIFERYQTFAQSAGLGAQAEKLAARAIHLDQIEESSARGKREAVRPDDIALIQFSSGSTSSPKGVQLTHRNITANLDGIVTATGFSTQDATLSWMPLTHDMGLIGFHLTPLALSLEQHLLPTELFVRRPLLWMKKATEKRATVLGSPNFGYRHYLRAFDHAKSDGLDLSRVRIIMNGAEPISPDLCSEFSTALAPSGLRASAIFPVYGLAEASVAVTFPPLDREIQVIAVDRESLAIGSPAKMLDADDPKAMRLVKVGSPIKHVGLRISDDGGAALSEGSVGHIEIRGDNVTIGYYSGTEGDGVEFRKDGWLDTGDVGFVHQGELVITGRAKDIIFSGGQNHFPQDLEALLQSMPEAGLGKAALCGVRAPNAAADEVVAFILHRKSLEEFVPIAQTVRTRITEGAGVALARVIPVAQIPKTTSGKVQRFLLRDRYLAGEFDAAINGLEALEPRPDAAEQHPSGALEQELLAIARELIPGREIGVNDNIFELGTSSLVLAQIHERIEEKWPNQLAITDFFDYPTIGKLAAYLDSRVSQPTLA
ncbi:MAG: non-ribosomal peptide synthetase [Burkholderiales bacterium]